MIAANPQDVRKAASFVEAIAKAEENFRLKLQLPEKGLAFTFPGVDPEKDGSYAVVRVPDGSDQLALGLVPPTTPEPRYPIAGR